jgi:hypothetical protein
MIIFAWTFTALVERCLGFSGNLGQAGMSLDLDCSLSCVGHCCVGLSKIELNGEKGFL